MFKIVALDCEMIRAHSGKHLCGRVVIVGTNDNSHFTVLLNTYVKYNPDSIANYLTPWSRITQDLMMTGIPLAQVKARVRELITGCTLVTLNGRADMLSMCFSMQEIEQRCKFIDIQTYFKRESGQPFGLGPLVEYFGYKDDSRPVVIDHDCVYDAVYTLVLYNDHYKEGEVFVPLRPILSGKEYRKLYNLR